MENNKSVVVKVKAQVRDDLKTISNKLGMGSMNGVIAMLIRDYNNNDGK